MSQFQVERFHNVLHWFLSVKVLEGASSLWKVSRNVVVSSTSHLHEVGLGTRWMGGKRGQTENIRIIEISGKIFCVPTCHVSVSCVMNVIRAELVTICCIMATIIIRSQTWEMGLKYGTRRTNYLKCIFYKTLVWQQQVLCPGAGTVAACLCKWRRQRAMSYYLTIW